MTRPSELTDAYVAGTITINELEDALPEALANETPADGGGEIYYAEILDGIMSILDRKPVTMRPRGSDQLISTTTLLWEANEHCAATHIALWTAPRGGVRITHKPLPDPTELWDGDRLQIGPGCLTVAFTN